MLSVYQLKAQIKLLEIWKSVYMSDYPLKCAHYIEGTNVRLTRAETSGKLIEPWNFAPLEQSNHYQNLAC